MKDKLDISLLERKILKYLNKFFTNTIVNWKIFFFYSVSIILYKTINSTKV